MAETKLTGKSMEQRLRDRERNSGDLAENPIKLSTPLRRCAKALGAIGVRCELGVDNRGAGGSQKELILQRADNWDDFER
jgi:hypothetical protein